MSLPLRVAILTTETTHHLYFCHRVASAVAQTVVLIEQPVGTAHARPLAFETERDDYERQTLLSNGERWENLPVTRHASLNDGAAVSELRSHDPQVILIFGTSRLSPPVLGSASVASLNLHGGNPEEYRGLDSHLWAIYHRDYDNLVTTLHVADEELDTGPIVFQAQLAVPAGCRLAQLRAINTQACIQLSTLALEVAARGEPLPYRRQVRRGRYYSSMPAELKELCRKRFEARFA